MASSESDDEPLATLAAIKKLNPSQFDDYYPETASSTKPPKRKETRLPVTIEIKTVPKNLSPTVIDRPDDVWLYLKDFNLNGPYSCLLCSEWFINRSKIIVHYVLTHKKDFCGICRYFVANRETWIEHQKFHVPWQCSQCINNFDTEAELRSHFSTVHKLVHCRLCCFRIPDNDQYNRHLYERHNVSNISNKNEPTLWELEYDGCPKFLCLLCSKSNNLSANFVNHYMCHHRITLKCFANLISGTDPPFSITGACISTEFLESQLKQQQNYGYMDIELKPPIDIADNPENSEIITDFPTLIPEVKQEFMSDQENEQLGNETTVTYVKSEKKPNIPIPDDGPWNTYKGDEDFDITSTELIILQKCYFEYINNTFCDINSNIMPQNSEIEYDKHKYDIIKNIDCPICEENHNNVSAFSAHIMKMHGVKIIQSYSCRVCAANFDTQNELSNHVSEEMKDFEDLWICQFCNQEFDTREATRRHLTEHWSTIEMDNCFSPHLGFKCRYCPTLFWNETDRETHQKRVHFPMHKEDYYKCEPCGDIFSDQIWFTHHYMQNHYKHDEDATNPSFLLKCSLCCLVLSDVETMRGHFAEKHGEARKIFCSLDSCKHKPFAQRKSFKIHLKVMHNPLSQPPRAVRCGECSREFASSRAAAAHAAVAHGAARFKCKLCERALATQDERKLHYLLSHPGRHPFECLVCGKSFPYKSSLYTHRAEHKSAQAASYTCTTCGKVFTKKDSFREHVQIHTGPRHACSYCPMRFVQRSNMLRHERRHTGERPFTCRHCSRQFADQGACRSHERTHSKERSFPCLYCGQCFVQKSKLTYHIRRHTGQDLETCTICSKLFTSACSLREHMKTHNKSEQVPCPLCDRRYQDSRYMLRHLRTAHSRAAHTCPVAQCGKRLTSQVGLRQHVLTHSKRKLYQCKICPKAFSCKRSMYTHLRGRHHININFGERNIREYCSMLDARECELGLSEETLTKVFGPPKQTATEVLIRQGISLIDQPVSSQRPDSEASNSEGSDSGEEDNIKKEPESEGELEPTDFVTVKIEPMGDDNE